MERTATRFARRAIAALAFCVALAAALALGSCAPAGSSGPGGGAARSTGVTLKVVAGSEVKDMQPIIEDFQKETGIAVSFTYIGTLDGTEEVMNGSGDAASFDATWFPSNAYMSLFDAKSQKVAQETSIMRTPVVLGVKKDAYASLGLSPSSTWQDIVNLAKDGKLRFGMSSPVSSNSGFSTIVELSTALSGTGSAITPDDVERVKGQMSDFAKGQTMTSGSSGWLMDEYGNREGDVDAVFNYESLILQHDDLVEVAPQDGVVTADYPLTLLSGRSDEANDAYAKLVDYLKRDDVQKRIADETHRRTDASSAADSIQAFEVPFPNKIDTVHALLDAWVSEVRKPANMVFQIDTSGSMFGQGIEDLKTSLDSLVTDQSGGTTGSLLIFQPREQVRFIEFGTGVKSVKDVTMGDAASTADLQSYISHLSPSGGTAMYSTLEQSLTYASQTKSDGNVTSVVLFTDGVDNGSVSLSGFESWYRAHPEVQGVPVYCILFGEADARQMQQVADLTGGKVFDSSDGGLQSAFKEIRGYL